jgi:pimeloyl-ACP methyl ester carboxylesterase
VAAGGNGADPPAQQDIRFCTSADGVRLAYATTGSGTPLVRTAHWLTHLEFDLKTPIWSGLIRDLSRRHRLVRYDERGTGLSDRNIADISFEAMVDDLAAVVDALKLERFALLGMSQGGPVSIAYAVRHPERVSHLILYGSYARGRLHRDDAERARKLVEASRTLIREGWGSDNPSFRQFFTLQYIPDATAEQLRAYSEMERASATPDMADRIFVTTSNINVKALVPQVRTPTLVMHRRDDRIVPFQYGQELASLIPGARFVPLDGVNHLPIEGDEAYRAVLREVAAFLGDPPPAETAPRPAAPRRRFDKAVRRVEQNAVYRILGMLAALASIASILIWILTQ